MLFIFADLYKNINSIDLDLSNIMDFGIITIEYNVLGYLRCLSIIKTWQVHVCVDLYHTALTNTVSLNYFLAVD